jgi:hypothetical protein
VETRFWSVVDRDGLTGLPSDMWAALDTLVARAALSATNSEAVSELVEALREMLRLADMGLEESLREPEENGNYAAYTRAKALLAKLGSRAP